LIQNREKDWNITKSKELCEEMNEEMLSLGIIAKWEDIRSKFGYKQVIGEILTNLNRKMFHYENQ